jgi:hypothetical protein
VIECGSLEYAQARLQARHGQRAGEAHWHRLETTREFGALLDAVRGSPLRPWVVGIAGPGAAQIEAVLRSHWRAAVAEVAAWMPLAWQASLSWCSVLPALPALQYLARGGEIAAWMGDDPDLRAVCAVGADERPAALGASGLGALAAAWATPQSLARAWGAEWERRLPRPLADVGDGMGRLAATLLEHRAAFAAAPPGSGSLLRRALQARLTLLLRRATLEPAAAFVHVALCALDFERLRGELLDRAVFAHRRVA